MDPVLSSHKTIKEKPKKISLSRIIPNCIMKAKSERRRPFIGNQIDECRDASGLFYILAFQRGYLVNWDVQRSVWDYIFGPSSCAVNFSDPVIITEPQFNFASIQEAITDIFFEEYECESLYRTTSADLAYYHYSQTQETEPLGCIVVDMGYSYTHVVPFIKGHKVKEAIRRIDIGGKVLTNHLKDLISYRQLNVMDETYVINQAKEDACFMSQNFYDDMALAKNRGPENNIVRDYVLPDFTNIKRGFLREPVARKAAEDDLQILRLNNERFAIPEILMHPSDVGIQQMGVAETIVEACRACPEKALGHLLPNIVVIGGCAMFAGMAKRLQREVRALAPEYVDVSVTVPAR